MSVIESESRRVVEESFEEAFSAGELHYIRLGMFDEDGVFAVSAGKTIYVGDPVTWCEDPRANDVRPGEDLPSIHDPVCGYGEVGPGIDDNIERQSHDSMMGGWHVRRSRVMRFK